MLYRKEIDGLRAVAVVPVVLFHAGVGAVSGGFVGVDIFFVISGFLITGILISEMEQGNFSIARFYERRARRILPALFAVMLCCVPFAWAWMHVTQLNEFFQSLLAVTLFGSNILFWYQEGYFEIASELKPLLHTWSLAVEEQYYLLFPLVLMALWKFGRSRLFWIILAAALASLMLSQWGSRQFASANFYLAPTRAWELLAGSLCAFIGARSFKPWHNVPGAAGFGLILFSIFYFDDKTAFPSLWALLPVGGTALILLYGNAGSWVARILGFAPFVGIGLISYSVYLWHQPLFAFARIRSILAPPDWLMAVLAMATFGIGYLSWRFIEQPFRRREGGLLPTQRSVFIASGAVAALLLGIGAYGYATYGMRTFSRPSVYATTEDSRMQPNYGLDKICDGNAGTSPKCATSDRPEVLLWGDSYAMHLAAGLMASDPGLGLRQITKSSCPPILGLALNDIDHPDLLAVECMQHNDAALAWLKANRSVQYVILSSPFSILQNDILTAERERLKADPEGLRNLPLVKTKLLETIAAIRRTGRRVVLMSPTPGNKTDVGQCLIRTLHFGEAEDMCDFTRYPGLENEARFRLMEAVAGEVGVIKLADMICPGRKCDTIQEGKIIYRDEGHLTVEGSAYLGRKYNWVKLADKIAN
jgi:peptidoglycan/LPS O-acetylase OafA/YrhL